MKSPLASAERRPLALFVLVGAQLAIGSAALLARAGLSHSLSPAALAGWRLLIAAVLVWVIGLMQARRETPGDQSVAPRIRLHLIAAGLLLSLHFIAWFISLQHVSVARSTLLVTTAPVWAGLGGALLRRERLSGFFWLGLMVAAFGMWLVVATGGSKPPFPATDGRHAALGDLYAILGALAIAAYLLLTQPYQATLGTTTVVSWTYGAAAAWTWLWIPFAGSEHVIPASGFAWLSVIGMALFPQLLGHTALNWSLRHFPAGVVSAATLLEPVFAGALAWVLLHEPLTGHQLTGAAILLAGVGLALCRPRPQLAAEGNERPA